mgnify:FL=1
MAEVTQEYTDDSDVYLDDQMIPPELRRRLQECYQRGCELVSRSKYDFDYANAMFTECVVADPANVVYIDDFLDNLRKKYGNNKRGARLRILAGKGNFKKAVAAEDWSEVFRLGPDILKTNPWDIPTLPALALACEPHGSTDAEFKYLKIALDARPLDAEVNRHCARSLERIGQFDKAIACWHRVEEACPNDREAKQNISQLTMEKNRSKVGIDEDDEDDVAVDHEKARKRAAWNKRYRAVKKARQKGEGYGDGPPTLVPFEDESAANATKREIKLTRRQMLEQAIVADPTELDNYFNLAELLAHGEKYGDAERVLQKAAMVSPGDQRVRERLENLELRRARGQLVIAEMRAAHLDTPEARQLVADLSEHLNRIELDFFYKRTERYPDDLGVKYELGLRLRKSGNFSEAIKYLLEAAKEFRQAPGSHIVLGECNQCLKRYTEALYHYRKAAETAAELGQVDCQLLGLYRAAVLASGLKEYELAEKHFRQIMEIDETYKDTQSRLDKIQRNRQNG